MKTVFDFIGNRYLFWLGIMFCLGTVLGNYVSLGTEIYGLISIFCLSKAICDFITKKSCQEKLFITCMFACIFLAAFWYQLNQNSIEDQTNLIGSEVSGKGVVLTYPNIGTNQTSFTIKSRGINCPDAQISGSHKLLVCIKDNLEQPILPGMEVHYKGKISLPGSMRNFGDFDYRAYLANQGVFYQLSCAQQDVFVVDAAGSIQTYFARVRIRVENEIGLLLPERESALLRAFLFGSSKDIKREEWEIYQRAGVLHLFAISGLHISFMLGTAGFIIVFFINEKWARIISGLLVLPVYYLLIGWKVSFVRSAVMVLTGMLACLTQRKRDVYTSMALAALFILFISPGEIFQLGFQLSFIATFGMVYYTPFFKKRGMNSALAAAFSAHVTTMPLIAYNFNLVSIISPLLNILAVFCCSAVAALGLPGVFLCCLAPGLAEPFFIAAGALLYVMSEVVLTVGAWRFSALTVAAPHPIVIIALYALLLLIPQLPYFKNYLKVLIRERIRTFLTILIIIIVISVSRGNTYMEVIFLDVGQGDSIFMQTPEGKTVLLDAGGSPGSDYQVGLEIVKPFLRYKGIEKIDAIIMSHNHEDHAEGLLELIPEIKPRILIMPPKETDNPLEEKILHCCREENIEVYEVSTGDCIDIDEDVHIEVLGPQRTDQQEGNNNSLVLRLVYGETEWLFTGDIETEAINFLLERQKTLQADVLKIPHHGSINSFVPEFYEAVKPQIAIVSAGYNLYNQPHPRVREYFNEKGIEFYLTKERGAISIKSDGKKIIYRTVK